MLKSVLRKTIRHLYPRIDKRLDKFYAYLVIKLLIISNKIYPYQPLYGVEKSLYGKMKPERSCEDRWLVINSCLEGKPGSFIDVGSQLGYFVYRMAEKGYLAIGLERDTKSYYLARRLSAINGINNAAFFNIDVTPQSVKLIPSSDIIACLSVFHHWVRENGLDYGTEIMQTITDKCKSSLIFETGQNNEKNITWAKTLDFMGENPKKWIENYLYKLGFSRVEYLGEFPVPHISEIPRHLFIAKK